MRRFWPLVYVALIAALLFMRFRDCAYDDVFITYHYAANLAEGAGLVYNPGERVLSTTSLLWAVMLAPAAGLGWDVLASAVLLGALSLALGGYCLWQIGKAAHQPWIGAAGLALYPLHPLVTGTLGSETPLYLALGLGALALHAHRRTSLAALLAGLVAVARPDGLLFAAALGLEAAASWWNARRRAEARTIPWHVLGVFLLAWLPWELWAWAFYGSSLPVTLAAKQAQAELPVSLSFWQGFWLTLHTLGKDGYFRGGLLLALLGSAYLGWRILQARRSLADHRWLADMRPAWLLLGWTLAYFTAYVLLGVSRYFWYYAPLLPLLVVGIGLGLGALERAAQAALARWQRLVAYAPVLAGAVCLALLLGQVQALARPAEDTRLRVYRQVGEWLEANTVPEARVGVLEVGIIGYYARRPMVDFAGLLQPETAAQLARLGSYERAARWAVQQYRLDAVVLHDGLFPDLEGWLAGTDCSEAARFPGLQRDMVIYTCVW